MALLATFTDYETLPEYNFVDIENLDNKSYFIKQEHLANTKIAQYFLIEMANTDGDEDEDIVLSALTYSFAPVPKELEDTWIENYTDLLILENKLH